MASTNDTSACNLKVATILEMLEELHGRNCTGGIEMLEELHGIANIELLGSPRESKQS